MASWIPASTEGCTRGDAATGDLVLELVQLARLLGLQGLDADLDLANWPEPPVCFLCVVVLDRATDGLAVGHLRLADVRLDLELLLHAVDQDVEVELAHAGDDRLAGVLVEVDLEGRVLLGEL